MIQTVLNGKITSTFIDLQTSHFTRTETRIGTLTLGLLENKKPSRKLKICIAIYKLKRNKNKTQVDLNY